MRVSEECRDTAGRSGFGKGESGASEEVTQNASYRNFSASLGLLPDVAVVSGFDPYRRFGGLDLAQWRTRIHFRGIGHEPLNQIRTLGVENFSRDPDRLYGATFAHASSFPMA